MNKKIVALIVTSAFIVLSFSVLINNMNYNANYNTNSIVPYATIETPTNVYTLPYETIETNIFSSVYLMYNPHYNNLVGLGLFAPNYNVVSFTNTTTYTTSATGVSSDVALSQAVFSTANNLTYITGSCCVGYGVGLYIFSNNTKLHQYNGDFTSANYNPYYNDVVLTASNGEFAIVHNTIIEGYVKSNNIGADNNNMTYSPVTHLTYSIVEFNINGKKEYNLVGINPSTFTLGFNVTEASISTTNSYLAYMSINNEIYVSQPNSINIYNQSTGALVNEINTSNLGAITGTSNLGTVSGMIIVGHNLYFIFSGSDYIYEYSYNGKYGAISRNTGISGLNQIVYDPVNNKIYVTNTIDYEPYRDDFIILSPHSFSYIVKIKENGLPAGTTWEYALNGEFNTLLVNSANYTLPNGTYDLSVINISGYIVNYSSFFTVNGANKIVYINFTATPYTNVVTFVILSLPKGSVWVVELNNTEYSSTNTEINISLPNGTYSLNVLVPSGYTVENSNQLLFVNGYATYVIDVQSNSYSFFDNNLPYIILLVVFMGLFLVAVALKRTR
jgi:hypothetical protein